MGLKFQSREWERLNPRVYQHSTGMRIHIGGLLYGWPGSHFQRITDAELKVSLAVCGDNHRRAVMAIASQKIQETKLNPNL